MVKTTLPHDVSEQQIVSSQQVRTDINALLADYLQDQLRRADAVDAAYAHLWRAINDLIMAGGKRVRPYLTTLAYMGCGGRDYQAILPVAVSQELFHVSLLIHDDIIDRDYVRYGHDNVAGVFRKKYQKLVKDAALADHYAHSAAILAGDLLLAGSHALMAQSDFDVKKIGQAQQLLAQAMFDVAGGELLDTESALLPATSVDSLKIAHYKTASYSFMTPLKIGATLAGAPQDCIKSLQQLGGHVGVAYQLMDDLLGIFGEPQVTGKPILSDLQEGKRTYLMQQALAMAQPKDRDYLLSVLGLATASTDDLAKVCDILVACGAKQHVESVIQHNQDKAFALLTVCRMTPEATDALRQLITKALKRDR